MGLLWHPDLPRDMNQARPEYYSLRATLAVSLTPLKPVCLANRIGNASQG